jgi:parallel beta-helix repeat protein
MFDLYTNRKRVKASPWKAIPLFIGMMTLLAGALQAQTPQYTFTNGATGTNSIPFGGGTWSDQRNQWFYAPGDFGSSVPSGKAIYKFYLQCGTITAATTWNDLTISMGQPSITGLTTTWVTGLTKVFSRSSYSTPAVATGTWVEFALDKPFPYDPTKPLVVETIQLSTSGGKGFYAGGTPINPSYTGNTQTYGASSATTGSTRRYSYAAGIDLKSLAANDMSVSGLSSPVNFCPGTYDIKINIENAGTNQVKNVKINWSKDGTLQSPISYTSTLDTFGGSGSRFATITLGSNTWTSSTTTTIKAWTSSPNGVTDANTANDTMVFVIKPSLSGTFTVGGTSPNYTTLQAAIDDLVKYGVCSSVTLNVRAGTYTGRTVIKSIPGASATNKITIIGAGAATTTLTYATSSTTDLSTILVDGADYITIQDFTINNTGSSNGGGVIFTGSADYNTLKNCKINVNATTNSSTIFGVAISGASTSATTTGSSGNYNTIDGNTITGGYYGITCVGSSTSTGGYAMGNRILNNSVTNYYIYGMYLYELGETKVISNKVNTTRYTSAYGLYFYYQSNYELARNEIIVPYYGIYSYYTNYYNYNAAGTSTTVNNNIINSSSLYGSYFYYFYYASFQYNSVRGNSTYASYFGSALTSDVIGNIFWNTSASYAFYQTGGTFTNIDYNVYYAPSSSLPIYYNSGYASLSAWQSAVPAFNAHSYQQDPKLNSSSDLHITKTQTVPYGPNSNYTLDVDGDARCRFAPTIGADESPLGKDMQPKAGMNGPDTLYVNSPTDFLGNQTPGVPHGNRWYINDVLVKDSIDFTVTIKSTGTYKVKVVAYGCSKLDSVTKTVVVINPTSAPASDFIASNNIIKTGDKVSFTELSSGGATQFAWTISPNKYYDNNGNLLDRFAFLSTGKDSARNPTVRFDAPGLYKICLTTVNAKGSNTLCKEGYVRVQPTYSMGGSTLNINDSSGYLYDNGGPNGLYSNSYKGGVLIAPCASDVYLVFNSFELECGWDYIRIYDGADNTGKPLHPCTTNFGSANGPGLTGLSSTTCTYLCRPATTDTFRARSGKMYIEMASDGSGNYNGFEAYWWSKTKKFDAPVADFDFPSTVCVDLPVTFTNKSTGDNVTYQWDLDDDFSAFETTSKNAAYAYFAPGKYTITLIAKNCGGVDTIQKELTVVTPKSPGVAFTADNTNPTTSDIVSFTSTVKECVSEYKWRFTAASGPGKAVFVNGTKATSANPMVTFTDTGCYTVFLYAKNAGGEDSLQISCFIKVKSPYCIPTVVNNVPDIGISQVTVSSLKGTALIDNKSTQGIDDYQNFTATVATTLEIGVSYDLKVARTSNLNEVVRTVWIDYNLDGDFNDAGEKVAEEKRSSNKVFSSRITIPLAATFGATVMRVAINQGNLTNVPCGPNKYGEYEDYRIYITPDLTKPVITLNGKDTVILEQGYPYTEAGATAEDNLDGNITSKIKKSNVPTFDNMIPGTYLVNFDVQDLAGNQADRVTRVIIVKPDVTAPQLVISGSDTTYVAVFDATYTDPQAVLAEDLVDGDILSEVVKTGGVDVNKVGTYTLTYKVADQSGNVTTKTRVIIVQDLVAPVITLAGTDTVYNEVNTPYTDAGVTYSDNYCANSDMAANLVASSNVNEHRTGTYVVVYNLTDCNGNKAAPVTRVVIIGDTKAPVATLNGDTLIVMDVFDTYVDKGITASDNYGTPVTTVSGTYFANFTDGKATNLGDYTVIYVVSDSFGNITSLSRTIRVLDREAPVISLKGAPSINVCRWATFNDLGYDLSDNFYTSPDITVVMEGDFVTGGTMLPGVYSFRYKAIDKSGNVAYSDWRIVNVREANDGSCMTSVGNGSLDKQVAVYPNPNNGKFTVNFNLGTTEQVRIQVLNSLGQVVTTVAEGNMSANTYTVDLGNQSSGVYMLRITAGNQTIVKRVIIAK